MTDIEDSINPSDTAAILAAGKALGKPIIQDGKQPVVIAPAGYALTPLPRLADAPLPDYIRQTVNLNTAESFSAYVKAFGSDASRIFALWPGVGAASGYFAAILDYHPDGGVKVPSPGRCAHRAVYDCPLSLPWKAWSAEDGKPRAQADFIEFLLANGSDIRKPEGAAVLEMVSNFESKTDVTFASKVCRVTGGLALAYKEDVTAGSQGGTLKVFEEMTLAIPVFEGGKPVEVKCRMAWKPRDGKLSVTVTMHRPADLVRAAFAATSEEIAKQTGTAVLQGRANPDTSAGSW